MRGERAPLLAASLAGMELCWRYAWAHYVMGALWGSPFPLPWAGGAFGAGALLSLLSRGRGWRRIQGLGVQAAGLAVAFLLIGYLFEHPTLPLWDLGWLEAAWSRPRGGLERLEWGAVLVWAAVFWGGGVALARRSTSYLTVCTRFDVGIGALLGLFLVRWLVRASGGPEFGSTAGELLLYSYFAFSLFAVGLARLRSGDRAGFRSRRRGVGLLLGVLVSAVLLGTAAVLLFLPHLTSTAEIGYEIARDAGAPLGTVLLRLLAFLFTGRRSPAGGGPGSSPDGGLGLRWDAASPGPPGWWDRLFQEVVQWGLAGLVAAALVLTGALGAWRLAKWLLARTQGEGPGRVRRGTGAWLEPVRRFLLLCAVFVLGRRRSVTAPALYAGLRRWGARGGVLPVATETPLEYGARLANRFSPVAQEIGLIVSRYVEQAYGGRTFARAELAPAARARRRLSSPRLWFSRLCSWFRSIDQEKERPETSVSGR